MTDDLRYPTGERGGDYRFAFRAIAQLVLLALPAFSAASGCASTRPISPPIALADRRRFEEGQRLEEEGRDGDAAEIYRDVVSAAPHFVAAQRALQNIELAEHRRGELLLRYGAIKNANPDSAECWYLWGRLLSSPRAQRTAFEEARRRDARSPWPWLGLGALALSAGDSEKALAAFRRGRELAPDLRDLELAYVRGLLAHPKHENEAEPLLADALDAEPWGVARALLLADLRVRQDRPREAIEILGRLLSRSPNNGEVAERLLDRLERDGTTEDATWLVHELEATPSDPLVVAVLARCHAMRGDGGAAIAAWNTQEELGSGDRAWRRLLRVLRGEVVQALVEESPRFAALERVGGESPAWHEAMRQVAMAQQSDAGPDSVELAAALSRLGWVEEAIALLRPGSRGAVGSEAASRLLLSLFLQRQLEAELKVLAVETYRSFAAGRGAPDFERFRARIGAAAQRALGDDHLEGTRTLSFWPVGELIDPTSEGGLPGYFRQCGRLFVAGERSGQPPELFLATALAHGTAGPQHAQLSFIEGSLIPGWLEHQGARFSGAALDRFVYVDVAAVEDDVARVVSFERKLGATRDRVLADPVLPARSRSERVDVSEPAEVATKLELRALDDWRRRDPRDDRSVLLAEALDAVLQHEIGHLEDAHRFLPISEKIWRNLPRLISFGFSAQRVEQWLEMRAQCTALARARNPYLVLVGCVGQAGSGGSRITPHGGGYQELLERLVRVIDEAPADFPEIDRGSVLLQQLDRLSPNQIRLAAFRILAELGIDEPQCQ